MFTPADLSVLLEARPALAVSIFLPTHIQGRETRQGSIRLKNLTRKAMKRLQATGLDQTAAETMLAPAVALVDDYDFWQHQEQGLAIFLGNGGLHLHKLPLDLVEEVSVGPDFQLRPLLPLLTADGAFRVLTISADQVQLFRASRLAMADDDSSALPGSLDEVLGTPDHENHLQSSPIGRPNVGSLDVSKAQVQGLSPEDWRKSRRVEYLRRIALALKPMLAADPTPVVLVGDAETIGHIRQFGGLGPLLAGTVDANPDTLDHKQLHARAYALMQPQLDQARHEVASRFAALHGSADAHATGTIEEVAVAAQEGRIEALLLAEGVTLRGQLDDSTGELALQVRKTADDTDKPDVDPDGDEVTDAGQDVLNALAAKTLRQKGEVYVFPPEQMPAGLLAGAILRY